MTSLRIGSLCSGYGGLDMAVQDVLGGSVAWHCQYDPDDRHQYAARILEHHWPEVPNHGDITKVNWSSVEKVEIVTAGWPCENMSLAGRREGLVAGVQSGLWFNVVDAIRAQQAMREPGEPGPFVFLENVRGLLSARADSDVEPCPWCLGDVQKKPALRALGAVLGDLAKLGLDAEWTGLPASGVGACHERWREFILAWPAAADPSNLGHERGGPARERGDGFADGGEAAAHPDHVQHLGQPGEQPRGSAAAGGRDGAAADPCRERLNSRAHSTRRESSRGDASHRGSASGVDWGPYQPAIHRHERVFGRPAPRPTQPGQSGNEQLSPRFTEWMMGLPAGHVTDVPRPAGMSAPAFRNACITACGKGVVPAQAAHALRLLLARAGREVAA